MNTIEEANELPRWQLGDPTKHPPEDAEFLEILAKIGFTTFAFPAGLYGAKSETRSVMIIFRGQGLGRKKRWELIFQQYDKDVLVTVSTDLIADSKFAANWLRGETLKVTVDSLCDSPFRPVGANDSTG